MYILSLKKNNVTLGNIESFLRCGFGKISQMESPTALLVGNSELE